MDFAIDDSEPANYVIAKWVLTVTPASVILRQMREQSISWVLWALNFWVFGFGGGGLLALFVVLVMPWCLYPLSATWGELSEGDHRRCMALINRLAE